MPLLSSGPFLLKFPALLQCSRCEKWRRLSDEAHAAIAADAEWFCEQNPDPAFASCEVQQEAEE
jgi:CW-type Zinc Finger